MVVISKKRIMMLTSIVCISLFICNIVVNNKNNNVFGNKNEKYDSVETMTLPVTNKVIVVDAGHRKT